MQDSDGNGVSPLTHRKVIQARWSNTGVITGLEVSGGSDMRYTVSAGCAVVSRSDSDGFAEAYWEGGTTGSVSSGDPSNPRIDVIWIKANDKQQGDPDNLVHIGVTSGTASASPVAPDVPAGCTEIARVTVPAGASSTSTGEISSDYNRAIPYGASLGLLAEYVDTQNHRGNDVPGKMFTMYPMSITVPTDRLIEFRFTVCASANGSTADYCDWYQAFMLDGETIPYSGGEFHLTDTSITTFQRAFVTEVSAGTHTVACQTGLMNPAGMAPYFRYGHVSGYPEGCTYQGNIFQVWDRGIAV